ncbi:NACHT domain-containing protein [Flavobacterium sp. RSP29]|uniref:NACHT domain-containing protein n=1 Tax=Flavobacterium sp. RSP29 TaxID=3401731 RepID=UPI003AAB6294
MTSQEKGSAFEIITKDFFVWLFEKIGFVVTKARVQKAGSQNGFDILVVVSKDYSERNIFIECKNYESDLSIGNIVKKGLNLESNYKLGKDDLFIAINPKSNFSNEDNSEKLSSVLGSKFPFNYYALEKSNGVEELFALNREFYKQIYNEDVDFEVNEEKEIERFKTILFSRKPFQKVIILDKYKDDFIGIIEKEQDYIARFISNDSERENSFDWNFRETSLILSDIVNTENKIFILGNPGLGKSTELKKLALDFWKEGEVEGFVPIFRNLKDFTNTDDLYNFLPSNWTKLNNILLVLDGIDEISDIEYFKSKLENFISKENTEKQIKYVISCRTNIYESIVLSISGFKPFYLNNLTLGESLKLLEQRCDFPIAKEEISNKFLDYLKTPFHIQIFASYINKNRKFPENISELWNNYIENRLSIDKRDKLKKAVISIPLIKKYSRKTSLINELMKTNSFTEENLFLIVNEEQSEYDEFLKNPLLDKDPSKDAWYFEHRNIQEYFAARVISELSFDEIIDFIRIEKADRTHPSLFNTITFLINLLDKDSDKFQQLIDWLIENQIEILFKADSDRTDLFKAQVFKDYFKSQCLEKKLWISTNRTFSVKEIAEFGDCDDNFEYLLEFVKKQTFHFRVVISALNLIGFFKPNLKREAKLKPLFIELLGSANIGPDVKSEIIRCIQSLKFCETDQKYLDKVFGIFEAETNKEINASLLFLIFDINEVDRLFWYIKAEFLRDAEIEKRNDSDEVHRGNDWKLQELILKLENSVHFIEIISYYLFDSHIVDLPNDYAVKLLDRCLFFSDIEDDFIVKFLKSINKKTNYYHQDRLLVSIITKSNRQLDAAEYLIDNNDFSAVRDLVSNFADTEILAVVLNRFKSGSIKPDEINFFRNNLWHHDKKVGFEFQKLMTDSGFIFDSNLPIEVELATQQKMTLEKIQDNFDILFNKEALLKEIKNIYVENKIEILGIEKIYELSTKWRKENNYPFYHDSSLAILQSLMRRFGSLTFDQVSKYLEDKVFVFKLVLDNIKGNTRENFKFVISLEQEQGIIDWCTESAQRVDFDNIIEIHDDNSFSYKKDFTTLKTILSFQKHFEFSLPKEFLLNCLELYEIENLSEKEEFFKYIFDEINDKDLFDKKVVENILNKQLFRFVLDRHIDYALKNNLKEVFPKMREYFLNQKPGYNLDDKLELYLNLTNDIDLLKDCCSNINDPICWSAIKLLTLREEEKFCITKSLEFLNQEEDLRKDYYVSNAMWVLFHFKSMKALECYLHLPNFDFHNINFSDYSTIEDYSILETLFFKIYKEVYVEPDFSHGTSFFDAYVSNLSKKDEESYTKTQKVLHNIKETLIKENSDTRMFNINLLIDYSTNSYINSKSVPLTFKEALRKVESILQ